MARTRFIKPAFFKNEVLATLPHIDRLIFIGLWTLADRDGRMEDRPRRISIELFPYEDIDIEASLIRLHNSKFITRYSVDENKYISINAFKLHQKPHPHEAKSVIPLMVNYGAPIAVTLQCPAVECPDLAALSLLHSFTPSLPKAPPTPDFEFSDWFERQYARHPKKKNKPLAEYAATQKLKTPLDRERFERVHIAWCSTSDWRKNNGNFAPKLDEWISDDGYLKEPDADSIHIESNRPPKGLIMTMDDEY